jgi:hypothetical protein
VEVTKSSLHLGKVMLSRGRGAISLSLNGPLLLIRCISLVIRLVYIKDICSKWGLYNMLYDIHAEKIPLSVS